MVRHINRLIEPTSGHIEVLGRDVLALGEGELRKLRAAQIGMVFQHVALFPHRTVRDNVAFPLQVQGQPKSKRWEVSQRCLSLVNLDGFAFRASCRAACSSASGSPGLSRRTPRFC